MLHTDNLVLISSYIVSFAQFCLPSCYILVLLRWQEFATQSVAVFLLTCHHGAGVGGEHQWVSRLRWLMGNGCRIRVLARDQTNRPLLFRDRISNCTNLFLPELNHTRDSHVCSWLTTEVEMLLIYRSTTSCVS